MSSPTITRDPQPRSAALARPAGPPMVARAPTELERPRVVAHVAVSLDGATTGFAPDIDRFYGLITTWDEDATLVGADTILAQERMLAAVPRPGPAPDAPLLAVVDGRRRVREWEALRDCGHWSGVVALRGRPTVDRQWAPVRELQAGGERVDLAGALSLLRRREGVETVRVDSGGGLIGALLADGLVDELSLLVHPQIAGRGERRWHGSARLPAERVVTLATEPVGGGLVWLRYAVRRATRAARSGGGA